VIVAGMLERSLRVFRLLTLQADPSQPIPGHLPELSRLSLGSAAVCLVGLVEASQSLQTITVIEGDRRRNGITLNSLAEAGVGL